MESSNIIFTCGEKIPVYIYFEGDQEEIWCSDDKNLDGNIMTGRTGDWWILYPIMKPGLEITKETSKEFLWFIEYSSIREDIDKQWDFGEHKVKTKFKYYDENSTRF